ncbi:uncharacterized protein SCHCODRAFT_02336044 [Schizophyllum commune H4-8]|uniref:uncharacterized protein n=1 Tax=Schizophyllum commune (strain H4-8 / FGSC 9210) TaxID=578458 RepID=UPI002160A763|nr:uncharacterized protein SCHCODRAFT_02336044 [Schizophyllum commune H4-8]KAI5890091.1 hypothetical protein SCHCODRAFT_02336044 [Schizophyllum commune H4-8]
MPSPVAVTRLLSLLSGLGLWTALENCFLLRVSRTVLFLRGLADVGIQDIASKTEQVGYMTFPQHGVNAKVVALSYNPDCHSIYRTIH